MLQQSMSAPKTPTWPTLPPNQPRSSVFSKCDGRLNASVGESPPSGMRIEENGLLPPKCCLPGGCGRSNSTNGNIFDQNVVKVTCSNENCCSVGWLHPECFKLLEESLDKLIADGKLTSTNKSRGWADKQKAKINGKKSLWECLKCTETMAACARVSGRSSASGSSFGKKTKAKKQLSNGSNSSGSGSSSLTSSSAARLSASFQHQLSFDGSLRNHHHHHHHSCHARSRTLSLCSAGSSPPSCSEDGVPPGFSAASQPRFDFFSNSLQAAVGNIFGRRNTLNAFNCLQRHQQNPYQIKVEDEGPHGNDEIRGFILTSLSAQKVTSVLCSACGLKMAVYDKYPLIDGTFFLSPIRYEMNDGFITPIVEKGSRKLYLNAICVECLSADLSGSHSLKNKCLRCCFCERTWSGSRFLLGSMYAYDIFAAVPCCQARLLCKSCSLPVALFDNSSGSDYTGTVRGNFSSFPFPGFQKANEMTSANGGSNGLNGFVVAGGNTILKFFSDYSKKLTCPSCGVQDYHFVKPLGEVYIRGSRGF